MSLIDHDQVIGQLTPKRPDQPLGESLAGRALIVGAVVTIQPRKPGGRRRPFDDAQPA
jgi:hypothetical protein